MKSGVVSDLVRRHFILVSCMLAVIIAGLYAVKGCQDGFLCGTWIIIALNVLWVPCVLLFKKNCFPWFYLCYALVLVFLTAFEKTFLFNNFTPLFLFCIVIGVQPSLTEAALALYAAAVSVAFILNDEPALYLVIHLVRAAWFVLCVLYVIDQRDLRRNVAEHKLVLYEDERKILSQLAAGTVYQKEIEGYSENTIYRKLKAARERNGCSTRDELVERFRSEFPSP